jgi:hypothetical protein
MQALRTSRDFCGLASVSEATHLARLPARPGGRFAYTVASADSVELPTEKKD